MAEHTNPLSSGWTILARNKRYVIWFYILNLVLASVGATAFKQRASSILDHSLYADRLVHGFSLSAFSEMLARPEFGPMRASAVPSMTLAVLYFVLTLVFLPGVFVGFSSDHQISREEFFRASGRNLWRFVRLTILFVIVAGIVGGILSGIQSALDKAADNSSMETLPFWVQVGCSAATFLILTAIRVWFDLAEIDAVLADQSAVRKSVRLAIWGKRFRFWALFRAYVATGIVAGLIVFFGLWFWEAVVPAQSVLAASLIGQIILLLFLVMRFWQRASAVSTYLSTGREEPGLQSVPLAPATSASPLGVGGI
jgi:hypothetical protein